MKPLLIAVAAFATAASAIAVAPAAHAVNLVVNGDFTQLSNGDGQFDTNTVVAGWSGNGGYNFVFTTADVASPGQFGGLSLWDKANGGSNTWTGKAPVPGNFAAMDGDFQTGPITQTVTGLEVGKTYDLSFHYAFGQQYTFNGATIQSLDASIGGTTWNSGDTNVASHGFTGWQSASVPFTATATSETLSFLAHGNLPVPPFAMLSDVSVPAVPEPAAWAMMLIGVAGMGAIARRRRAAALAL
jgi:hypothetical protein